ncbi:MAG: UDP-N-acetylglucosamine--N-acetylmuramyl-(pentapeptide) pyrophosphoryl-undecaprenol N-acetylglucosamine transferase, partial [Terriglobales bacterium]
AINQAVKKALPVLLSLQPEIQIVHQVGEKNLEEYKSQLPAEVLSNPRYQMRAYFDDLAVAYAACDVAICRAGEMTISELGASGTAAIFIPYPFAAQDHQTHNARAIESKGAARVIMQSELTAELLVDHLKSLLHDDAKLQSMRDAMRALGRPNAAADLAEQIKELSTAAG